MEPLISDKDKRAEGLLSRFMDDRLKNYVAPSRKGVPRGEPIGFSEAKHKGVLLSLTSIDLDKQAEMLGVSYGLLRKWRSENRFFGEVERYATEFAGIFYQRFVKAVEKDGSLMVQLMQGHYEYEDLLQKIFASPSDWETNLFDDLEFWGFITRDYVVKRVLEGARKNPGKLLYPAVRCIGVIRKDPRFRRRLERLCISYLILDSISILLRPEISEEDQRNELIMLGAIERWLSED